MAVVKKTLTLNNGVAMPVIGLGTWKSQKGEVGAAVKHAIGCGYRHIDCAFDYNNEHEVGSALAEKLADGSVTRAEMFITTKLSPRYNAPERVEEGCRASLKNLQLKYVDLYLVHWPVAMKEGGGLLEEERADVTYVDTWREIEKLVGKGLAKAVGVSNFSIEQLQAVLNVCKVKPAVNQIEVHPYLNNKQLVEFCQDHNIVVTAYAPFASPDPGRPTLKADDPKPLENDVIKTIGAKYNKSPAQVILKWLLQRGVVTIPKSVTPARIEANIQLDDFHLSSEEMDSVNEANIDFRACIGKPFTTSKFYPFKS